ncbi:acyl carrier protein [Cellulosilyticum sp. ST5]|uniref:Acyl carrier protein n=1 Tax=Cellulosilyticum lentocellum (strain ATCC 49066 / DSM 5427 / NCIMB 11756 / RHM5) TaxID=642492 RepID=F2JS82_CELLD|nr:MULTISPECIES: acyl carrier protein [Cellulosilyticum]ADZ84019.1 acyl carrier protein [Cellulosilyticum lentocellum DSM 5427]QEH69485.1 acyl carrier protein [Cellulosilyticum sp. WCF-2]
MVFDKVKQIISEQFNISEDEITLLTSFTDDLNADSLDVFQVIMAIEEEFEMEISNEEAEKVSTVGDVVEYIKDQKGLD